MNVGFVLRRVSASILSCFLYYQVASVFPEPMSVTVVQVPLLVINGLRQFMFGNVNCIHRIIQKNSYQIQRKFEAKIPKKICDQLYEKARGNAWGSQCKSVGHQKGISFTPQLNIQNCNTELLYCYYNNSYYKGMSEDKMDHQEDLKGASRRSRKDEQGRDYVCGCGKRYLSYPALYTHIKTKHDGQQPEGTQKTGVAPVNRRVKPKLDDRVLKQVQNLVHFQNLNILSQLDQNAQGSVPMNSRVRKQILCKQLVDAYNLIIKSTSGVNLDKKSSLEMVLICYLIGVGQFTSESMFQYYCNFVRLFRNCFVEYAQEIYEVCFKSQDGRKDRTINLLECKMAPIICDFFLRFYVPYEKKDNDFQAVMEFICYDFCQWMYLNRWTIVEVSLKKIEHALRKNLIEPKNRDKKGEEQKEGQDEKEDKEDSHEHQSSSNQSEFEKQEEAKEIQASKREGEQNQIEEEQNNEAPSANSSPPAQH